MGHYSIREVKEDFYSPTKYQWIIYAGNFRTIACSDRLYNNPRHALRAIERFIRLVSNAQRNPKIVRLSDTHGVIHRDKRRNGIGARK